MYAVGLRAAYGGIAGDMAMLDRCRATVCIHTPTTAVFVNIELAVLSHRFTAPVDASLEPCHYVCMNA
jgi:hypothetical protein